MFYPIIKLFAKESSCLKHVKSQIIFQSKIHIYIHFIDRFRHITLQAHHKTTFYDALLLSLP